ncbi:hypothetical protein PIB30_038820 [Stylosanthes scabra]|uniref:Uncharacterized protein n=1 Tax=Stylosanthes scabra TaxID=79078 RepID=A0ABU6SEA1_9FABA|nr:hypothetical protein [Stylosanthes scabra]
MEILEFQKYSRTTKVERSVRRIEKRGFPMPDFRSVLPELDSESLQYNEDFGQEAKIAGTETYCEQSENSDPEIQVHIQPNSDPEFQEQDSENQNSEAQIDEGDASTIQIVTAISYPSSTQIADTEFKKITRPQLNSKPQNRSQFQSQYDENEDELQERRFYRGSEDWNTAVVVQRPPPESPDLQSLVEELFPIQTPTCQNMTVVAENECEIHTGAEDVAVAKGNVDDDEAAMNNRAMTEDRTRHGGSMEDMRSMMAILVTAGTAIWAEVGSTRPLGNGGEQETTSGAEVGAIAETGQRTSATFEDGKAMEKKNGTATVADGGLWARRLRRVFLLTPPSLLAAVLPWNRVEART